MGDMDVPSPSLSLLRAISPYSMTFLHRGQTRAQVIDTLAKLIYVPETDGHRVWLLISQVECVIALLVSVYLLLRKKTYCTLWLVSKRESAFGGLYVTNAVFTLVIGIGVYLLAWRATAITATAFSIARRSSIAWWWIIPAPWTPLVVGAYVSMHGFILSSSPRSPLSPVNSARNAEWFYLPVAKRPAVVNTTLVLAPVLYVMATLVICGFAAQQYHVAKHLASDILPIDILDKITYNSNSGHLDSSLTDVLASDDLLCASRRVAAAYLDVHRLVCINLILSSIGAFCISMAAGLYGVPNSVYLVDHACSLDATSAACTMNHVQKTMWLISRGRSTHSDQAAGSPSANTCKMTLFAQAYVWLIVICAPLFGVVPIVIVASSFPSEVQNGDFSPTLRVVIVMVSLIILVGVGLYVFICTVFTLDPLFRSALGLNLLRTRIRIEVKIVESAIECVATGHASSSVESTVKVHEPGLDTPSNGLGSVERCLLASNHLLLPSGDAQLSTTNAWSSSSTLVDLARDPLGHPVHQLKNMH
ncbi:Dkh6 virulence factor [Mycosarcoma maydis]|uniref:Dkh6 n=1 Tax=Mycosarcoma maydis TaxID=5270 RepID=Q8X1C0_MYCMD|nr:Dkh6 virulence factor [Ustilago maydis 521]AAL38019.1 Dkh6 [Ustilago maydis]KIS67656.1 Dkh6 virulence factor [Ustilago maydis 521]|eukprot:XP_011390649.1 Dkh6 virulence factor [Ustilago maydis 521]